MRGYFVFFISFFLVFSASAQTQIPPEVQVQACQSRLLEVTQEELGIRGQAIVWQHDMISAQNKVKDLEAKIKQMEDKYEPKNK